MHTKFTPFKREGEQKVPISPLCSPPLINDQSLTIHSLFCHLLILLSIISVIKHTDGQFDFAKAEIKMNESWAHIVEI